MSKYDCQVMSSSRRPYVASIVVWRGSGASRRRGAAPEH